jgi:ribosomal protein L20A (L18A)
MNLNIMKNRFLSLIRSPKIFLIVLFHRLFRKYPPLNLNILNDEETLKYIQEKKLSFIRIGDWEIQLITGIDISFQKYSNLLKKDLIIILKSDNKNFLLGLAKYINMDENEIRNSKEWRAESWRNSKILLKRFLDVNRLFGDATFFYKKSNFEKFNKFLLNRNIIIVSKYSEFDLKDKIKAKNIDYIIVPSINSYELKDEIIKKILELYKDKDTKNTLVLLSSGPAGKVIGFNLILKNIQVIDCGHYFDFLLNKKYVALNKK